MHNFTPLVSLLPEMLGVTAEELQAFHHDKPVVICGQNDQLETHGPNLLRWLVLLIIAV